MSKRAHWPTRTVIIDTREQIPWPFPTARTTRTSLSHADYSLLGLEDVVRIERKSLQDLVGSLSPRKRPDSDARSNRERFKEELQWLGENVRWPYLIFESTWDEIAAHNYRGGMHPSAVIGAIIEWSMKFGIHVIPSGSRMAAFAMANRLLCKAEQLYDEEQKELADEQPELSPEDGVPLES